MPTHDINSHQKVNIFYNGLGTMNRQLLYSQGLIPGMTPAQALTAIQTMVDHSQKWHDGTSSRNTKGSSNYEGFATIVNKLENLGRDMKKLKENVHTIQVGCQICGGAYLDKDCPLNEEVKSMEEVIYGEFGRPFPNNNRNDVVFVILDMVKDLRMPIILGRPLLATAHAKVDIFRKSISLEVGSEKVIFKMRSSFTTTFESVRSVRSDTCPEDDDFKKIDYDLFFIRFGILITEVEKEKQSRPKERRVHWCKAILQEKENGSGYWPSCDPNHDVCDGGDSPINKVKRYWESMNDSQREELEWENLSLNDWMKIRYGNVCKMTRERILKDHWRDRFGEEKENLEDPKECGEDKSNAIMGTIHDKLNDDWFNNTSEDEDDLEGILDYLEPRSYDRFINLDDEAYNKRSVLVDGWLRSSGNGDTGFINLDEDVGGSKRQCVCMLDTMLHSQLPLQQKPFSVSNSS
ncbi:hypothetical protein Tco_0852157 [Tanacetum coccineum]